MVELQKPLVFDSKIGKIDVVDYHVIDKNYAWKAGNIVSMHGYTKSNGINRNMTESPLWTVDATTTEFFYCQSTVFELYKNRLLQKDRQFCVNLRKQNKHNTNKGKYISFTLTTIGNTI